jgi:hypothetical protein
VKLARGEAIENKPADVPDKMSNPVLKRKCWTYVRVFGCSDGDVLCRVVVNLAGHLR